MTDLTTSNTNGSKRSHDSLGDRMKAYEAVSTARRAFKGQPLIARLDGKNFHGFTRGLRRPYDARLTDLMVSTTRELVDVLGAAVGYTQSDEITLAWHLDADAPGEYPYGGRFQKVDSLAAAHATAHFNRRLPEHLPEKSAQLPVFDCRSFAVPNLQEAYHVFLWRQQDATKNAIFMAAQSMYSHLELQRKSGQEMQEMMFRKGVNFNEYSFCFKRGTFVRRVWELRELTSEQLARIPEEHRPSGPVERSFVDAVDIWLTKQSAPINALFYGGPIAPDT